jgi:GTP diphosphokinase / guanosine-3',5'-bis(diphosphate) 3'-diphosphatase
MPRVRLTLACWGSSYGIAGYGEMSNGLDQKVFSDFVRALAFASRKHSQQRRKDADASPYINHPIALVSILAVEAGINDGDTLCAALLHDTIEDTDTSVEELVEAFGGPVASLVQEVTDDKRLPKAERKLRQVAHAAHLSPKARAVKLADKIANLRDVADCPPVKWSLPRRQEYFDWAKQVVDNIPDPPPDLWSLFMAPYDRRP